MKKIFFDNLKILHHLERKADLTTMLLMNVGYYIIDIKLLSKLPQDKISTLHNIELHQELQLSQKSKLSFDCKVEKLYYSSINHLMIHSHNYAK